MKLQSLLFADDIVLVSSSANGLQQALNIVSNYCKKWKLTINFNKSKVMIFNRSFNSSRSLTFTLSGVKLDICNEYVYLGIVFVPSGSFKAAEKRLASRGNKSFASWRSMLSQNIGQSHDVRINLKLFDAVTKPVLLYNSEIWMSFNKMFHDYSRLVTNVWCQNNLQFEKVHTKCCKQTLKVSKRASNIASLAELGRYPLISNTIVAMLSYWRRASDACPNNLVTQAVKSQQALFDKGTGKSYYLRSIENLCKLLGLDMHSIPSTICIREKIYDLYRSNFFNIAKAGKLSLYSSIKRVYKMEHYLLSSLSGKQKQCLTKFRISAHKLPIESGRQHNIPQHERKCNLCSQNVVGNEYHYFIECDQLNDSRRELLKSLEDLNPNIARLPDNVLFTYLICAGDLDTIPATALHISNIFSVCN